MSGPVPPEAITLDELKQRAVALGIPIPDPAWEQIYPMVSRALAAVRSFEAEQLKRLEPSVAFRALDAPPSA